jgi:hypothetical protein
VPVLEKTIDLGLADFELYALSGHRDGWRRAGGTPDGGILIGAKGGAVKRYQ